MDDDDDDQQEGPPKESSSECSSRGHKKDPILIKLKISIPSQENGSKEVKDPLVRTCEYCGREFMNGNALGGHIKIHNRERKLKGGGRGGRGTSLMKLKRKFDELELGSAERDDAIGNGEEQQLLYTCCICNKRFQTYKSLCGHMKFHPERSRRVVQQPKVSEGDDDDEEEEEEEEEEVEGDNRLFSEVDLLKDLESWSKTEKRGRISLAHVEPEAARGLMKLACAVPKDLSSSDDGEGDHIPDLKKKKKDRDEIRRLSKKDFKIPEVEDSSKIGSSFRPVICKKKAANRFRFECITCHKIFPTFQALGCHRSVHNKDRGIITHPSKISPCPDKKIIAGNAAKEDQDSRCYCQVGNLCKTYHEKSPTGHVGPPDQDLLSGPVSPGDEASVSGPRPVLPIDLNEIPTTDDDEALDSRSSS